MIHLYTIFDRTIYIDDFNSNYSFSMESVEKDDDYRSFVFPFEEYHPTNLTLSINVSNACNLKCDYCFNNHKDGRTIDFETAKRFIDNVVNYFPKQEKYYIDLSGNGEPLLSLPSILKINNYCKQKQDETNREFLVSFVSNGTLLDKETSELLQKKGILFGVSLDGDKRVHDMHRKTVKGENTYDTVLKNVQDIEHHEYVGAAVTITNEVFDLLETVLELNKTFNTISVKPVRQCDCAFNEDSLNKWLKEYDKLTKYLLEQAKTDDIKLLKALLNGNDYFGKFIIRTLLDQKVIVRCDGGISRFSLGIDNNVYVCPAAIGNENMMVGTNGTLDPKALEKCFYEYFSSSECKQCPFHFLCGGECLIERKLNGDINNHLMCLYKRHLILLAIYFDLELRNLPIYLEVVKFCHEVVSRGEMDKDLDKFLKENNLKFSEGKLIYDKQTKKY